MGSSELEGIGHEISVSKRSWDLSWKNSVSSRSRENPVMSLFPFC